MDYTTVAVSYSMLLIPLAIAVTVVGQGVTKLKKKEAGGKVIVALGVIFLLLVPTIYFLLVHV